MCLGAAITRVKKKRVLELFFLCLVWLSMADSEPVFEQLFFDGTLRRTDENGQTYTAFRVEVEVAEPGQSYALLHLRVRLPCR